MSLTLELHTPFVGKHPVYLVGNFNEWAVADDRYRLTSKGSGVFSFKFPARAKPRFPIEYKYTLGSWDTVELDEYGGETPNRIVEEGSSKVTDYVPRWRGTNSAFVGSYMPTIKLLSDRFEMPQLGKTRRVWIILPYNYASEPERRYPVVYMQDGQNLFDPKAPFGTWGVDKKLSILAEKGKGDIIVVGIDHGDAERIHEFSPPNSRRGTGKGRDYVRFISETLKPFVDANYRTLSGREHTGIGGSSLGGLISIYAGLMFPEVFGRLMIFSPSLWMAPKIYFDAIRFFHPFDTRVYLYAGGNESRDMVPNAHRLREALERRGFDSSILHFKMVIDEKGKHNELRWGREFPRALEWLFFHERKSPIAF